MLLINTSIRQANNTAKVIAGVRQTSVVCNSVEVACMARFPDFESDYITDTAGLSSGQSRLINLLDQHHDHLYFVPTYYKSMPGVFKNFLDVVRIRSLFNGKRIGIVSTNAKNQDYGARQFLQSLMGILEFHQAVSVVIPQILILNPEQVDGVLFERYADYFYSFPVPGEQKNPTATESRSLQHT